MAEEAELAPGTNPIGELGENGEHTFPRAESMGSKNVGEGMWVPRVEESWLQE